MKKLLVFPLLILLLLPVLSINIPLVQGDPGEVLLDSWGSQNAYQQLDRLHPSSTVDFSACGQSFQTPASPVYQITSAKFGLEKRSYPTGMAHAVLYAESGNLPTGSPLATSEGFDISTLTTSYQIITFTFNETEQYVMQPSTWYCIVYENPTSGTIDAINHIWIRAQYDPFYPTGHPGYQCIFRLSVWYHDPPAPNRETMFYVYGEVYENPPPPENINVTITNMEGCGNWVFAEEKYYIFNATYNFTGGYPFVDTVKLAFTDGVHWINATHDYVADEWFLESGEDVVNIKGGSTHSGTGWLLYFLFPLYFKNTILDALDVDIWLWANNTDGDVCSWKIGANNYFNIYNLGGQSTLETTNTAGRLEGGDVFDLYAEKVDSVIGEVESTILFRNLQHVKLLPAVTFLSNAFYYHIIFGIDYCTQEDDWITGWSVDMKFIEIATPAAHNAKWVSYNVTWYNRGEEVKKEQIYIFNGLGGVGNNTVRFWVDLWFNKENASSTIGGRINAYYFPMKDDTIFWLRWLTTNWGPDNELKKQSMMFTTLLDADNNTLSATQIKLVKVRCKLIGPEIGTRVELSDYDVFDYTFGTSPMSGIQTPVFDETKVPVMPVGGFLGALVSAIGGLGKFITDFLGPALLGFFSIFLAFIETVFNAVGQFFGITGFGTTIREFLAALPQFIADAFVSLVQFLTTFFTILAGSVGPLTSTLLIIGDWIVSIFQVIGKTIELLGQAYNDTAVPLLPLLVGILTLLGIMIPFKELERIDEYGFAILFDDLNRVANIVAFVIDVTHKVIFFFVDLLFKLIEAIPIGE